MTCEGARTLSASTRKAKTTHRGSPGGDRGRDWREPGESFYDNAIMDIQLMECARLFGVEKFISLGTICSYPKFALIPLGS
jgi:GDP-L-fucose synthase